jgi:5'-3' exonuclease
MCRTSNTQVKDDFRAASSKEKENFLKEMNAVSATKSVLLLTQGFKGEKTSAIQNKKTVFSSYPITNLKTQFATSFSFDNTLNLEIVDTFSNETILIVPKKAQKHKFIYLKKDYKEGKAKYLITFSNTLRPLK